MRRTLFWCFFAATMPAAEVRPQPASPSVTYLANMGVMLDGATTRIDHFQAAAVAARLAVDARVRVIAPQEVMDSLVTFAPALRGDRRLTVAVPGMSVSVGGASVMPLDLPHNPTATRRAQNVGYVVSMAGIRVLHVGDANSDAAQIRALSHPAFRRVRPC